jgi:hypothetical protein
VSRGEQRPHEVAPGADPGVVLRNQHHPLDNEALIGRLAAQKLCRLLERTPRRRNWSATGYVTLVGAELLQPDSGALRFAPWPCASFPKSDRTVQPIFFCSE